MTVCSRSCVSSLLALSAAALLLAGCGGRSPEQVRQAFAAERLDLASLPKPVPRSWGPPADLGEYLASLGRRPRWPLAIFTSRDDRSAVLGVVVFRSAADAERERRLDQGAPRSMEHVTRVGTVVVYWDAAANPRARQALERVLDALR